MRKAILTTIVCGILTLVAFTVTGQTPEDGSGSQREGIHYCDGLYFMWYNEARDQGYSREQAHNIAANNVAECYCNLE